MTIGYDGAITHNGSVANSSTVSNSGIVTNHSFERFEYSGVTTIPSYSAVFSPVITTSTVGQVSHLSGATGGLRHFGFSTTSTAPTARALLFTGILGSTAPTAPAVAFQAMKHNGTTGTASLTSSEIVAHFMNDQTILAEMLGNGNTGFGVTTPTAKVQARGNGTTTEYNLLTENSAGTDRLGVRDNGAVEFSGNAGTAGQVLTSGGSSSPPTWTTGLTATNSISEDAGIEYRFGGDTGSQFKNAIAMHSNTSGSYSAEVVATALIPNNSIIQITVHVNGINSDGSEGYGGTAVATFRKTSGGSLVLIGSSGGSLVEDVTGTPTAVLSVSSGVQLDVVIPSGTFNHSAWGEYTLTTY